MKRLVLAIALIIIAIVLCGCGEKTCPSCGNKVTTLITKKDAAGVYRTWCSSCWYDYNKIMGI